MQLLQSYRSLPRGKRFLIWLAIWLVIFIVLGLTGTFNLWTYLDKRV